MDRNNQLAEVGQRLGLFAYMTVMGGGRPFWAALFEDPRAGQEPSGLSAGRGGGGNDGGSLPDGVPFEYQRERRQHIAA